METQRKNEKTNLAMTLDANEQTVFITEFTEMTRVKYADGTWSNWAPGARTFWRGTTKVFLNEQDGTFTSANGMAFKLVKWGDRTPADPT